MEYESGLPEQDVDYTEMVIHDMYAVLTTQDNPWPGTYTKAKKLEFIDRMLEYLQLNEDFEKCTDLQKMKKEIINETVNKIKKSN